MSIYRRYSSDVNAPVMTGQVGALIALLDAILINGYGNILVSSITRSGAVATVTTAINHGLTTGRIIQISGANEADYNGLFTVTVTSPTTFTYAVANSPSTPATGANIRVNHAGLGWSKVFTGTNKAVYQSNVGTRHYLRVDDTGTTIGRATGYFTMTDVDTGAQAFPRPDMLSGGMYWQKSVTADATVRSWNFVSDGKMFHLFINWNGITGKENNWIMFGDYVSYKQGVTRNALIAGFLASGATVVPNNCDGIAAAVAADNQAAYCIATATAYNQIGDSQWNLKITQTVFLSPSMRFTNSGSVGFNPATAWNLMLMGTMGASYPYPLDNGMMLSPIYLSDVSIGHIHGYIPGVWNPCHNKPFASTGDQVDGSASGSLSTRSFEGMALYYNGSNAAQIAYEISDTWGSIP